MVTYLQEDKLLFSCDFLGAHLATSELYATEEARVHDAAKRYYAEIMMPFRSYIQKHLEKLAGLQIDLIAPSHGPVHSRPAFILDLYRTWASDEVKKEVVIAYISMYQSTASMVTCLIDKLIEKGLSVKPHNVTEVDMGELAMSLVEASTVVFASPTVLAGPHPSIACAAYLANALKPKTRFAAVIGSFGWGSTISDRIQEMLPNLQVQFLDPVLVKGLPKQKDYESLDRLAEEICRVNNPAVKTARAA
jgi:flavorubredoxin